jgi:hypothetical protein
VIALIYIHWRDILNGRKLHFLVEASAMTNYAVSTVEDLPIITAVCLEGFKLGPDMIPMMESITAILKDASTRHIVIFDLEHASFGMDDIIATANIANRPDLSIDKHPAVRGMIAVSTSRVIGMALRGMNSPVFGNFSMPLFPTLDEAIAHAKKQLSAG